MTRNHLALAVALALALLALPASAEWPQWRGPNRDGHARDFQASATWPEALTRVWTAQEVGEGYAGPLVSGDSVWLHTRIEGEEVVTRRRLADGSLVWSQEYAVPYEPVSSAATHGKGPKSTPVLSDGRLFTLGISGVLSAFDASSGEPLWRKDFVDEFAGSWPTFGVGMSPLIVHGKLIAHVGTDTDGALIAFNPVDGSVAWRWADEGPSYVSPVLFTIGGREQIISQSAEHSIALDAETGELLWRLPFTTPFTQNIMTPVLDRGVIVFSGTRAKSVGVRVSSQGGQWKGQEVWSTTDATIYMSSPVLAAGRLYGFTEKDSGNLFCADPQTGKLLWKGPGRMGTSAALIAVDGYLLTLTTNAELIVTRLGADSYEPLKTYSVSDSATWAHPAVVGNRLLIKDGSALTLWSLE